jgi:hypothetical protein
VEREVRYVMAWLLREFADVLAANTGVPEQRLQPDRIIDVAFDSDLQSGTS